MNIFHFFQTTPPPSDAIGGYYNFYLVVLSYVVAVLTSFVALEIASYMREGFAKTLIWPLIGGAFAMGAGIFSMHFIGMLAYIMPMRMGYGLWLTLLSLLIAIVAAGFALYMVRKREINPSHLLIAGLGIGIAIAGMHYVGMAGMTGVKITYYPLYFTLSILIAVGAATAALWLIDQCGYGTPKRQMVLKAASSLVMGAAICGMHYMGMTAAVFVPSPANHFYEFVFSSEKIAFLIAMLTGLILFIGLYAIGRQLSVFLKLIFGYLIIIFMMVPLAYTSIEGITSITRSFTTITDRAFPKLVSLFEIKTDIAYIGEITANLSKDLSENNLASDKSNLEIIFNRFEKLEQNYTDKSMAVILARLNTLKKNLHTQSVGLINAYEKKIPEGEIDKQRKELKKTEKALNDFIDEEILEERRSFKAQRDRALLYQQRTYLATIIGFTLIFSLAFLISLFISYRISKPIIHLRNFSNELAKGDLQKRAEINSQDEIGQLGESLNSMAAQLEQTKKKRDEFVGMAAHDLRIPLSVISEGSHLMATEAIGNLNSKQHRLVEMVSSASASMIALVDELLTANPVQNQAIQINRKEINLKEYLQNIWGFNLLLAEKKHIDLELQDETGEERAFFDENKISQVINNFISNAIKFSLPHTHVTMVVKKLGNNLRFEVHDEAGGIPEDEHSKVFSWFSKISVKPTGGEATHGLGLAICKDIIQAHDGEIGFASDYGKGSIFFFEIKAFNFPQVSQEKKSIKE